MILRSLIQITKVLFWYNFLNRVYSSKIFTKKKLIVWLSIRILIKSYNIILIDNFLKLCYKKEIEVENK